MRMHGLSEGISISGWESRRESHGLTVGPAWHGINDHAFGNGARSSIRVVQIIERRDASCSRWMVASDLSTWMRN